MSTETDETITVAVDNLSNNDCDRKNKPLQGLSPYELKRLENIRHNQAFLTAIELPQANAALKRKPSPRGIKREKAKVSKQEVLPLRKSLRLLKKDAEVRLLPEPRSSLQQVKVRERPEGPVSMAPVNMEEDSLLPASLLELWSERFTMVTKEKWNLEE